MRKAIQEEYHAILFSISEVLLSAPERRNSLDKECKLLSLFTRLDALRSALRVDAEDRCSQESQGAELSVSKFDRHAALVHTVTETLLRFPKHKNAHSLLALLNNPL